MKSQQDDKALLELIPLLFHENTVLVSKTAELIHSLFLQLDCRQLCNIDEKISRRFFDCEREVPRRFFHRNRAILFMKKIDLPAPGRYAFLRVLTTHHNGYIRQAAIEKLVAEDDIETLVPVLLIKANDWVEPIRSLCYKQLNKIINSENATYFIKYFLLVSQLRLKSRIEYSDLIENIEKIFLDKYFEQLIKKLHSKNRHERIYAFYVIAKSDPHINTLLAETKQHDDFIIRSAALSLATRTKDGASLQAYLNDVKNDKASVIRRDVLYTYVEKFPEKSQPILEEKLFDATRRVRSSSQFYLKSLHDVDAANHYRSAIKNNFMLPVAIRGLAESGTTEDFANIIPFINGDNLTIKISMIDAIFKLKPKNWKELLFDLTPTDCQRTLKAIAHGIKQNQNHFIFAEIARLLYDRDYSEEFLSWYFFRVLSRRLSDRWIILYFLLEQTLRDGKLESLYKDHHKSECYWLFRQKTSIICDKILTYECYSAPPLPEKLSQQLKDIIVEVITLSLDCDNLAQVQDKLNEKLP